MRWVPVIVSASLMAGCVTTVNGDFCDTSSPIRPSVEDRLTDGTAAQILKHNTYGARACGWKAKP
jgi:hypothetical protein